MPNPFRPGFNQPPMALAGRAQVIDAIDEALAVAAFDGRTPRPLILAGARGVGKTVILGEAAARAADEQAWLTAPVEIRSGTRFVPQLIERLGAVRDLYRQSKKGAKLTVTGAKVRAAVLGVGGEIDLERARTSVEPALPLEMAIAEACDAASEHGAGVLITVDELQLASRDELSDFAATLQQHVPDAWPLVVALAGLPSIRSAHKGVTYLERAEWHVLGLLDQSDAVEALQNPAAAAQRSMTDGAATDLAEASGGYPYAIQLVGHHAWRVSSGASTIDDSHVPEAIRRTHAELASGLYAARWEDSSEREREYLSAMAHLGAESAPVTGGMVAIALQKTTKSLSWVRNSLIQKGTIFTDGDVLRFAIPGLGRWIREMTEQ